jgi:hypothetical protein
MLTSEQVEAHVQFLIEKAKDYDEIGPSDLIDDIPNLTHEEQMQIIDALFDKGVPL